MERQLAIVLGAMMICGHLAGADSPGGAGEFRQLKKLPAPQITDCATEYPGGAFRAAFILDGNPQTEFASNGKGADTFIEFDFGRPVTLAGLSHQDRNDVATIGGSELTFLDAAGKVLGTERVTHVNQSSGVTTWPFAKAVTAQRVRWRTVQPGSPHSCLGGAELAFFTAEAAEGLPRGVAVTPVPASMLERLDGRILQPLRFTVEYPYAQPCDAVLEIEGLEPQKLRLTWGRQEVRVPVPEVKERRMVRHWLRVGGEAVATGQWPLDPVRPLTIYILPHSHVDIGYTEHQSEIEKKQLRNLARALELIKATAGYPEGARYKWNVEVLWAVESFLRQAPPEQQREFFDAVRNGQMGLQAMYGNELTGLCRPEELMQLFAYATRLGRQCGVPVDNAMISDVPGYTWGVIPAMAQAGVKYWSIGPNLRDRIGTTRVAWEDKPFYWVGPSGKEQVLCALPYIGYAMSHITPPERKSARVIEFLDYLREAKYPYEMVHLRWSGYGDNAVPDESLPDWVKEWNERYAVPRLVIATGAEAFREFEKRCGDKLPRAAGDWTPYWEDGAGSTVARDGPEPRVGRPAGASRSPVGHARPDAAAGHGVQRRLAERAAVQRAHVGRSLQHHAARRSVHDQAMGDEEGVRRRGRQTVAGDLGRSVGRTGPGVNRGRRGGRVQHDAVAADRFGHAAERHETGGRAGGRRRGPAGADAAARVGRTGVPGDGRARVWR